MLVNKSKVVLKKVIFNGLVRNNTLSARKSLFCDKKRWFTYSITQNNIYSNYNNENSQDDGYDGIHTPLQTNHMDKLNKEKDLIMKILSASPSKREAKSYLQKYCPNEILEKKVVDLNVSNEYKMERFPIALINVEAPFDKDAFVSVVHNIAYLHKLGLNPIITLENKDWYNQTMENKRSLNDPQNFQKIRRSMIKDALMFCELIELEDIQSRLITSGAFQTEIKHEPSKTYKNDTRPIIDDVFADARPIVSCLKNNCIPVLLPICSTPTSHYYIGSSNDTMPALSRTFSKYGNKKDVQINNKRADVVKVILINSNGGIRNPKGKISSFVNLQDDYHKINNFYKRNNEDAILTSSRRDLKISYKCLSYLPATSSAVVIKASTAGEVVGNLITDKPLENPSLSHLGNESKTTTTVLRYGLELKAYRTLKSLNKEKLFHMMEASFGKKLNRKEYEKRLEQSLDRIIIAGDYQGCAIVTKELHSTEYLDKFAVCRESQGIGVADVLWQRLKEDYSNMMWRSRSDNGVNKWYFERSDGNLRISDTNWVMFWYGAKGINNISLNISTTNSIPASFYPGKGLQAVK